MRTLDEMIDEAIALHLAEIKRLESARAAYHGTTSSAVGFQARAITQDTTDRRRGPRVSKYEPVFKAYEAAGRPLSIDDMMQMSSGMGFPIDRSNMRSIVHTQKNLGRAHPVGDGYVWGTTSSPEGETGGANPPATFAHSDGQEHEGATVDRPGVGGT